MCCFYIDNCCNFQNLPKHNTKYKCPYQNGHNAKRTLPKQGTKHKCHYQNMTQYINVSTKTGHNIYK